jgi:hypothetical protein
MKRFETLYICCAPQDLKKYEDLEPFLAEFVPYTSKRTRNEWLSDTLSQSGTLVWESPLISFRCTTRYSMIPTRHRQPDWPLVLHSASETEGFISETEDLCASRLCAIQQH